MKPFLRISTASATALLALATTNVARAQYNGPAYNTSHHAVLTESAILGSTAIGWASTGDLNGDGFLDAAILAGTDVAVMWGLSFDANISLVPVNERVYSACIVKSDAPTSRIRLGVVTDTGAKVFAYNGSTGTWSSVSIADAGWIGATKITCADAAGGGYACLFGISSNGMKILRAYNINNVFVPQTAIPLTSAATEIALAKVGTTGQYTLGLIQSGGFSEYAIDGTPLWSLSTGGTGHAVTRLRRNPPSGALTDQFAFFTSVAGSSDEKLYVIGNGTAEGPLATVSGAIVGASAADCNGDGYDDLAVTIGSSTIPILLTNTQVGGSTSFDYPGDAYSPSGVGCGTCSNTSFPLFDDFDNDGVADLAVYTPSAHNAFDYRPAVPYASVTPGDDVHSYLDGTCVDNGHPAFLVAEYAYSTVQDGVTYTYALPTNDTGSNNPQPPGANVLRLWIDKDAWTWTGTNAPNAYEVVVYLEVAQTPAVVRQLAVLHAVGYQAPSGSGVNNQTVDHTTGGMYGRGDNVLDIPLKDANNANLDIIGGSGWSNDYRYYVKVCACTRTGSTISNRKTAYIGCFTGNAGKLSTIPDQVCSIAYDCVASNEGGGSDGHGGEIKLGGFVAVSHIPPFANGGPEQWPALAFIGV